MAGDSQPHPLHRKRPHPHPTYLPPSLLLQYLEHVLGWQGTNTTIAGQPAEQYTLPAVDVRQLQQLMASDYSIHSLVLQRQAQQNEVVAKLAAASEA